MKIKTDDKKIMRGVECIIEYDSFQKKILSGKKLRVKHGIDPTGPKIHLGRALQFQKLRLFQELGHKVVLIIGDFTAQIGDASDKQTIRRSLSEREIKKNMKDYEKQIGKILDMKKVELRYNSEWLGKLTAKDLISLSTSFTAQQLIQRRNFKERWDANKPIGLHELDYPLFQGLDSVAVRADIELGGSDQLFNLLAGCKIQRFFKTNLLFDCLKINKNKDFYKGPIQNIITLKMLSGLDGRKMSTSWENIITIIDSPEDMYGKIMSMKDELIFQYFELCTFLPMKEIKQIEEDLAEQKTNPRDVKAKLAREIVIIYHSKKEALSAEKEFERVFKEKKAPTKIPEIKIKERKLAILDLLVKTKIASSKSEAKRLILQKGVKIENKIQDNWQKTVEIKKGMVIQVGKRRFIKLK